MSSTSNAGSADVQDLALSDGRPLWQLVAHLVNELAQELVGDCGLSSIGAVVGATHPRAVAEARKLLPQSIFLLPGVGAQGATPADVARWSAAFECADGRPDRPTLFVPMFVAIGRKAT